MRLSPLRNPQRGFSLVELAVVLAIVALLVGGAMATLSSQVEQRNFDETRRRLDAAVEAVIAYAIVNRRLPCPARYIDAATHSQGLESFCIEPSGAACTVTLAVQVHGNCSNFFDGYLPAASVGAAPGDGTGFAIDAWSNRLRYAVARGNTGCTPPGPPANTRVFTSSDNLKTYGVGCRPNDLDVCATSACASRVVSVETAVFIVNSIGKNGAIVAGYGNDENENTNGNATFVSRTPSGSDSALGTFDDILAVVPVGVVYSKLIAAGVLP